MALRIDKPNKQLMLLNWTDFSINLNDQDQYVYEMTHFDLATAHIAIVKNWKNAFIPQYNKIKNKLEFRYLHYRSTLSENIKLCPKIQFSEKCQNCEFEFLCQKWMNYYDSDALILNRPQKFSFINNFEGFF